MAGLNFYLVSYDIRDDKRWRAVHRVMKEFGNRLHYSVFRCDLTKQGKFVLIAKLDEIINHNEDRIMIVDLGPSCSGVESHIYFLGEKPDLDVVQTIIV
jgi:CRISPR-associated protein Cas2